MSTEDFKAYFEANQLRYQKWGNYLTEIIVAALKVRLGYEPDLSFIKLPISPRLKGIESALGKIKRKGYASPISDMTDLVGLRIVVLLSEHIEIVSEVIQQCDNLNTVISKDIQEEIERNPKLFDYQSQHFEVRPKKEISIDNLLITTNICCEVQIRTLLQHAYAELVHDSVYKPVGPVPRKAERQIAKSMALMETTDELFCSTMALLKITNKPRADLYEDLIVIYRDFIGGRFLSPDQKTNFAIFDEYRDLLRDGLSAEISRMLNEKKFIIEKIRSRAPDNILYSQPIITFIYWLVLNIDSNELCDKWPLSGYWRDLGLVFSDLGENCSRF